MRVEVQWTHLTRRRDDRWSAGLSLYAYLPPDRDWLLYVGKADFSSTRRRLHGAHKDDLFRFFRKRYGIDDVRVLHGELILEPGRRRSSELLADTESLLIMRLQPPGNIASTKSRIQRPGLRVLCSGDWPFKRRGFRDTI